MSGATILAVDTVQFGSFQLTGGNPFINLVAAGTNALNDGRPLLGRKLHKRSRRELRDLGLLVDDDQPEDGR